MLKEAIENGGPVSYSSGFPVCIIMASSKEVSLGIDKLIQLLRELGYTRICRPTRTRVFLGDAHEFRFFTPGDPHLVGREFADVYIDHRVWDVIDRETGERIREIPTRR